MQTWLDVGSIVAILALIYTMATDYIDRRNVQAYSVACWIEDDMPFHGFHGSRC